MAPPVLSTRELNRALMARQGLLSRRSGAAAEEIERLVGLQGQEPENAYVALWLRLSDFDPLELSSLIASRAAVRSSLMRATIHLSTSRDCLAWQPLMASVLHRTWKAPWMPPLGGEDVDAIVAAGAELLQGGARTRAEIRDEIAPRFPKAEPLAVAYAVTSNLPLVQVPPRGLWQQSGAARWALTEEFLGAPLSASPSVEDLVLRYLTAFGPASSADVRTWSNLTGLRPVLTALMPDLRVFHDEAGRELLDVPDGLLPDPDVPAPPRFLPEYDNVALGHKDRSRVFDGRGCGGPFFTGKWHGTLWVDGFYRANWRLLLDDDGAAVVTVDRLALFDSDPAGTREEIVAEAEALGRFVFPDAASHATIVS
ncbi:MAG: AlkZ family DNA glycosylase [Solirubrobacteraceae bacterium]|nr:AlkZ family DNA glycosylase [Solirubrobacteraceae bacterium]